MKYIISRYNHNIDWIKDYTNDYVLYDRSVIPAEGSIITPNIGSDIYDKFTYIRDNYDNLPEVAVYTKANMFKYISRQEFDEIKDNKVFTPILTQYHKTYSDASVVCKYEDGIYCERNDYWYLGEHRAKNYGAVESLKDLLGMRDKEFMCFAPGSNYILTKENIRKHPKEFYQKLLSYLDWAVYPGEAQMMERSLYNLWKP